MTQTTITPMKVAGVRNLVDRAYRESGALQYLRELLRNAIEADATRIEFGPEWRAVERDDVYRLMVADNGRGMEPKDLLRFLNTFGGGGKPIGEEHENFGVGAKTSLLPWNRHGVVAMSWTESNPEGAMIWLMRDPVSGEYGARKFETDDGEFDECVQPFGEWADVKPDWLGDTGTVVVCLGDAGTEDTFVGKEGQGDVKAISAYLNKRFWDLPEGIRVYVQELRSTKRDAWPRSLGEARSPSAQGGTDRRWNRRRIRGAEHFVVHPGTQKSGAVASSGIVGLRDGTELDWYLWNGERPKVHAHAHRNGYIAALYLGELYDTQTHVAQFRTFGVTHSDVRTRLTLVARPPKADGESGVYPDTATPRTFRRLRIDPPPPGPRRRSRRTRAADSRSSRGRLGRRSTSPSGSAPLGHGRAPTTHRVSFSWPAPDTAYAASGRSSELRSIVDRAEPTKASALRSPSHTPSARRPSARQSRTTT